MHYGVASVSRINKIIVLFCRRALQMRRYSAKETWRAAARRTAPKLPRAIRVGPNEGDTKMGGGFIREFIQSFGPKIRGLSDFQTQISGGFL